MDLERADVWEKLGLKRSGDGFRKMFTCDDDCTRVTVKHVGGGKFDVSSINPAAPWDSPATGLMDNVDLPTAVAFVIAAANSLIHDAGWQANDELMFAHSGTAIHDPFSDMQFGEWLADLDKERVAWVLRDPVLEYGDRYLAWRDSMLELVESGRLPSLERQPAPAP